jgi:hypothetical protein
MDDASIKTQKQLRYCAYRWVWVRMNELTPIAKIPWDMWFHRKYGMDIFAYHRQLPAERRMPFIKQ